jgi:hypothetical protein
MGDDQLLDNVRNTKHSSNLYIKSTNKNLEKSHQNVFNDHTSQLSRAKNN